MEKISSESVIDQENILLCDFLGVTSLERVNIDTIGIPPLSHLSRGVVCALYQATENRMQQVHGMKQQAAKKVLAILKKNSVGCCEIQVDQYPELLGCSTLSKSARSSSRLSRSLRQSSTERFFHTSETCVMAVHTSL